MDRKAMLTHIDEEIERLTQARKLLAGTDGSSGRVLSGSSGQFPQSTQRRRRRMSAAGRRRISEAQKKRWAAQKRAAKKA